MACAPSNAAVDNLVERLAELDDGVLSADDIVRVGDPERISSAALGASLDARVSENTAAYFDKGRQSRRSEILAAERRGWSKQEEMRMEERRKKGKGKKKDDPDPRDLLSSRGCKERRRQIRKKVRHAGRGFAERARRLAAVGAGAEACRLPAFDLAVLDEPRRRRARGVDSAGAMQTRRALGDPRQLAPLRALARRRLEGLAELAHGRVATPQQMAKNGAGIDPTVRTLPPRRSPPRRPSPPVLGCALETQYRSPRRLRLGVAGDVRRRAEGVSLRGTRTLSELPGVRTTKVRGTPLSSWTRGPGRDFALRVRGDQRGGLARKSAWAESG